MFYQPVKIVLGGNLKQQRWKQKLQKFSG